MAIQKGNQSAIKKQLPELLRKKTVGVAFITVGTEVPIIKQVRVKISSKALLLK